MVKNPRANAEDMGLISESGRYPGEGRGNPLQYSCLGNSVDRERSLAGYSPWRPKRVRGDLAPKATISEAESFLILRSNYFSYYSTINMTKNSSGL